MPAANLQAAKERRCWTNKVECAQCETGSNFQQESRDKREMMFSVANAYRLLGLLFWIGNLVCVAFATRSRQSADLPDPPVSLSEYFFSSPVQFEAVDAARVLRAGDPVFQQDSQGQWTQIGHVETRDEATDGLVNVKWYADSSPDGFALVSHFSRGSMEEVIATMLPESKRQQIQRRLSGVLKAHG